MGIIWHSRLSDILAKARRARAQTGRPVLTQIVEMLYLRASDRRILADEYFDFRLYEPTLGWAARREYLGRLTKNRVYRIQSADDSAIASDKLRAYGRFHECGLAFPAILAIAHPDLEFPGAVSLRDGAALEAWLRNDTAYPFFAKPAISYRGYGARLVTGRERDRLRFGSGETMPIARFAELHGFAGRGAALFQERIRPHPDLAAIIGDRTATARIMVLNDGPEPEVFRASLRIPVGNNMTDNFHEGKTGNLIARLDRMSGRLAEVLAAVGLDRRSVEQHPDTGKDFAGMVVPDWDAALALVRAGSKALPGIMVHSWDVAFSDRGPLLVETNPRGDYPQQANNRGLAEPRFLKLFPNQRI